MWFYSNVSFVFCDCGFDLNTLMQNLIGFIASNFLPKVNFICIIERYSENYANSTEIKLLLTRFSSQRENREIRSKTTRTLNLHFRKSTWSRQQYMRE